MTKNRAFSNDKISQLRTWKSIDLAAPSPQLWTNLQEVSQKECIRNCPIPRILVAKRWFFRGGAIHGFCQPICRKSQDYGCKKMIKFEEGFLRRHPQTQNRGRQIGARPDTPYRARLLNWSCADARLIQNMSQTNLSQRHNLSQTHRGEHVNALQRMKTLRINTVKINTRNQTNTCDNNWQTTIA